jgi:hypothetical protein
MTWTNAIGHGAMNQRTGRTRRRQGNTSAGTAALRDFNPAYDVQGHFRLERLIPIFT